MMQTELENIPHSTEMLLKPSSWLIKINFLNQLWATKPLLAAIFGEAQEGKTSFVQLLCKESEFTHPYLVLNATASLHLEEIVQKIQIAVFPEDQLFDNLSLFIEKLIQEKMHFTLIIDDAHHLTLTIINALIAEIRTYAASNCFHVGLIGNYSLNEQLHKIDAGAIEHIHGITISPLTENETRTFTLIKLQAINPQCIITQSELQIFYKLTQGRIHQINTQFRLFFEKKLKQKSMLNVSFEWMAMTACFIIMAGAITYISQNIQYIPKITAYISSPTSPIVQEVNVASSKSYIAAFEKAAIRLSIQPPPRSQVIDIPEEEEDRLEKMALVDSVIAVPKLHRYIVLPQAMHRIKQDPLFEESQYAIESLEPELISSIAAIQPLQSRKIMPLKPKNKPAEFTIQLLASHNIHDLYHYMHVHSSFSPFKLRLAENGGEKWYVLTLGEYGQRKDAQQALAKLPHALAKAKPWVRSAKELKSWG